MGENLFNDEGDGSSGLDALAFTAQTVHKKVNVTQSVVVIRGDVTTVVAQPILENGRCRNFGTTAFSLANPG